MASWASDRAGRSPWQPHGRCPDTARSRRGSSRRKRWRSRPTSASTPTRTSWSRSSEPMPISLPERMQVSADALTPRQIVAELDKYVVGQHNAKRAVAIALRNRTRRQKLAPELAEEVAPKNILMIGPTGVGKTEIARRLARLANAPFLKVEATKFTEVGYVGRDVEQIVRDLLEIAIAMTKDRMKRQVQAKAEEAAEGRVLDALVGEGASADTRSKFRKMLRSGELDDKEIELKLKETGSGSLPTFEIPGMPGASMGMINLNEM